MFFSPSLKYSFLIQIKPFLFDFTSGPGFGEYYSTVDQLIHTCNDYFDLRIDKEKIKQEFYKLDFSMAEMVVQAVSTVIEKHNFKLKLDE